MVPPLVADAEDERKDEGRVKSFDATTLKSRLDALSFLPREGTVVDGDILTDHGETRTEQLRERPCVHEDEGRPALIQRIVNRGEAGGRLRGDVEVPGGLEVFVDRTRPLDLILIPLLERRDENLERRLPAKQGGDRLWMTDGRRQADSLEISVRDATETLEADRELDPPAVRRGLMDLADGDVRHAPEVTPRHRPR